MILAVYEQGFHLLTSLFSDLLSSFPFRPRHISFLLPPTVSLETIETMFDQGNFPKLGDLAPALTYAVILSVARFLLQSLLVKPLAEYCMKIELSPFQRRKEIDRLFSDQDYKSVTERQLTEASASLSVSVSEIRSYLLARRRHSANQKKYVKFVEALWRFLFYSVFVVLGIRCLVYPEVVPWVKDTNEHWAEWPYHQMTESFRFYYHVELGAYIHQVFWSEVHHSDFLEMFLHHIITIFLICGSFLTNFWRVGTSILLLHDTSDIFLEGCKVLNYTSRAPGRKWIKDYLVDPGFGVFTIVFFVTRLVLYPRYILYSVIIDGYKVYGCEWGGCYFFIGLLVALQCLHLFWFYLIMRMVYRLCTTGIEGDVRSEEEEEEEEEEEKDGENKTEKAETKKQKKTK